MMLTNVPIFSRLCTGTVTFFKFTENFGGYNRTWLPFERIYTYPLRSKILIISSPETPGSFGILHGNQVEAHIFFFDSLRVVVFETEERRFFYVLQRLLNGLPLAIAAFKREVSY